MNVHERLPFTMAEGISPICQTLSPWAKLDTDTNQAIAFLKPGTQFYLGEVNVESCIRKII